ncbi:MULTISPECIES: DUF981 domain-containing protein [unclassified Streptomyces]|uniref:DUF981 domain-containing protein n=1 Tax=unclassified Streptomyces TaxID=2593676 RepID=UPI001660CC78|nr:MULTISPECIES: DUF981 domain-containing protein [unclassified Streptomyces]MBD0708765.1 hypothetical protein [Streptomyces sp. CBMA291]MBD0714703.1 hypothetical protein [Streptomyces sp. CBMA370]
MTPYALPLAASGLKIDWTRMPTYNTIMSVAAGAGLLLVVALGHKLLGERRDITPDGWALAFGALGFTLVTTGLHMTLTWPLAGQGFPFDNVIFGEPALAFGVFLLAASLYLWKRGADLLAQDPVDRTVRVALPISVYVFGMGLACFGIAAAGWKYTLFAAPPEEPISGEFADWPWLEASFMSGLYVLVGIGAVLFPFALRRPRTWTSKVVGVVWALAGIAFLLFGGLNYFTHIGLIVNTM